MQLLLLVCAQRRHAVMFQEDSRYGRNSRLNWNLIWIVYARMYFLSEWSKLPEWFAAISDNIRDVQNRFGCVNERTNKLQRPSKPITFAISGVYALASVEPRTSRTCSGQNTNKYIHTFTIHSILHPFHSYICRYHLSMSNQSYSANNIWKSDACHDRMTCCRLRVRIPSREKTFFSSFSTTLLNGVKFELIDWSATYHVSRANLAICGIYVS